MMIKAGWAVIVAAIVLMATYSATAAPACQSIKGAAACAKRADCQWVVAKGKADCRPLKAAPRRR